MENEKTLDSLRALTKKMMKARQIDDYDLNIEGGNDKGENYLGDIIFFDVSCKDNEEKYNLVFKTSKIFEESKKNDDFDKIRGFVAKLFKNETYMYSEVLPRLRSFAAEIDSSFEFDNVPKMYFFSSDAKNDSLILENLKPSGYRLWDRTKPMNLEHIKLVLENYGKFHAVSMALKDQKQENFQDLIKGDLFKQFGGKYDPWKEVQTKEFKKNLRVLERFERKDLAEKFEVVGKKVKDLYVEYTPQEDRIAILHGDCWVNNFMFKYRDNESLEPLKMCFIDFQLSHLDSPVKDLSFFIYTSCDETTLKQFDSLLEIYYASLSSTLRSLGSNPEDLFTMEQLKEHWQKYSIFGFVASLGFIKMELFTEDDIAAFDKFRKDEVDQLISAAYKIDRIEIYERRLLDVFVHYADTCL